MSFFLKIFFTLTECLTPIYINSDYIYNCFNVYEDEIEAKHVE